MVPLLAAREWRPGPACRIVERLNGAADTTLEPEMSSICLGNQLSSHNERAQDLSASFSACICRGRAAALLLGRTGAKAFVPLVFLDLVADAGSVPADLVCDVSDRASLLATQYSYAVPLLWAYDACSGTFLPAFDVD